LIHLVYIEIYVFRQRYCSYTKIFLSSHIFICCTYNIEAYCIPPVANIVYINRDVRTPKDSYLHMSSKIFIYCIYCNAYRISCMYICIYLYMYTYIHIFIYIRIYVYIYDFNDRLLPILFLGGLI
jgi:hypothetical protein